MSTTEERLLALHASVDHLRSLVAGLGDGDLERSAYPSEWTVADVLSHLGSGAVIFRRRIEDGLAGRSVPDDFAPSVWDEWNAKPPRAKADDALAADRGVLDRLDAVGEAERASFATQFGPMTVDFEMLVGFRLNEHVVHTWDVEVAGDPAARLQPGALEPVLDNLELIARFTARPTGATARHVVRTADPQRLFAIELSPEGVAFGPSADQDAVPDLELPAEAFVRLVYGRLDDAPADLRSAFPGP